MKHFLIIFFLQLQCFAVEIKRKAEGDNLQKFEAKVRNDEGQKNGLAADLKNLVKNYLIDSDAMTDILTYHINHNDLATQVQFSPCGTFLSTGSCDGNVKITNILSDYGDILNIKEDSSILFLRFASPRLLTYATKDHVKMIDITTADVIASHELTGPFSISKNGKILALRPKTEKIINVYDIESGQGLFYLDDEDVTALNLSPDGRFLITTLNNGNVIITDLPTRKDVITYINIYQHRGLLELSPNNQYLITSDNHRLNIININKNSKHAFNFQDTPIFARFSPNNEYVIIIDNKPCATLFELKNIKFICSWSSVNSFKFNHQNNLFIAFHHGEFREITLPEMKTAEQIGIFEYNKQTVKGHDGIFNWDTFFTLADAASSVAFNDFSIDAHSNLVAKSRIDCTVVVFPLKKLLESLPLEQMKLLYELKKAKELEIEYRKTNKVNKNSKLYKRLHPLMRLAIEKNERPEFNITLNKNDQAVFDSLPRFIKLALRQNLPCLIDLR